MAENYQTTAILIPLRLPVSTDRTYRVLLKQEEISFIASSPQTWCRHVYLLRTTLRLCQNGPAQSVFQNHQEGGAYDRHPRFSQSDVHYHKQGVAYDQQLDSSQLEFQNDKEVKYSKEEDTRIATNQPKLRDVGKFQEEQTQRYLLKPDQPPDAKILRVAILGAPNAGKSTLVNHLLTWKVNPVSTKVHTTRKNSLGVFTEGNTQIIFTDTPGVITPAERKKHHCDGSLMMDPRRSMEEVDLVGVLVDVANRYTRGALHKEILKILNTYQHIPSVLILNKVDELKKHDILLELINTLTEGVVGGVKVPASPIRRPKKNKKDKEKLIQNIESKNENLEDLNMENPSEYYPVTTHSVQSLNVKDLNYDKKSLEHTANNQKGNEPLETASQILEKAVSGEFQRNFYPAKITNEKEVEPKEDLSKYVTPWEQLMPCQDNEKRGWPHFDRVFMVSSLHGDGMEDLKTYFMDMAVRGDWVFHSSLVTDEDPHQLAKLIVWSKLLDHLKGYVAYQLDPDIAYWKYEDGTLKIVMNINVKHVDRVIGPGGVIIKEIAEESQQALMDAFRCEVALKLIVRKKANKR